MVEFNIDEPFNRSEPHDCLAIIKVWSGQKEERVRLYYNKSEAPEKTCENLNWLRNKAIEYVDFNATGAKVKETSRYVESGWGGYEQYA